MKTTKMISTSYLWEFWATAFFVFLGGLGQLLTKRKEAFKNVSCQESTKANAATN